MFFDFYLLTDGSDGSKKVHSFFEKYDCQIYNNTMDVHLFPKLKAPKIDFTAGVSEDKNTIFTESCDAEAFLDWLGCIACGVDW